MAILQVELRESKAREIKGRAQKTVELTQDVYDQMSYAQQVIVNLYEVYIDDLSEVAVYENNGTKSYYVRQEDIEKIAKKFKLV